MQPHHHPRWVRIRKETWKRRDAATATVVIIGERERDPNWSIGIASNSSTVTGKGANWERPQLFSSSRDARFQRFI